LFSVERERNRSKERDFNDLIEPSDSIPHSQDRQQLYILSDSSDVNLAISSENALTLPLQFTFELLNSFKAGALDSGQALARPNNHHHSDVTHKKRFCLMPLVALRYTKAAMAVHIVNAQMEAL
jgi:hypothetical protein